MLVFHRQRGVTQKRWHPVSHFTRVLSRAFPAREYNGNKNCLLFAAAACKFTLWFSHIHRQHRITPCAVLPRHYHTLLVRAPVQLCSCLRQRLGGRAATATHLEFIHLRQNRPSRQPHLEQIQFLLCLSLVGHKARVVWSWKQSEVPFYGSRDKVKHDFFYTVLQGNVW